MQELLVTIVEAVNPYISFIGVIVIVVGVARGVYDLILMVYHSMLKRTTHFNKFLDNIMRSLVIGLDFFLAGDIILTVVIPSSEKLISLGGIVLIRIVLEYFLIHIRKIHFSR
ncbi:MAG: DUF1622 domain-containing protein [bacterium]|nr:DUF1622 domain-containing protein [bacterium]